MAVINVTINEHLTNAIRSCSRPHRSLLLRQPKRWICRPNADDSRISHPIPHSSDAVHCVDLASSPCKIKRCQYHRSEAHQTVGHYFQHARLPFLSSAFVCGCSEAKNVPELLWLST